MIYVTTQATVESETTQLIYPRIGYQTHTRNILAAAVSASSEAVGFPKDATLRPETYEFWKGSGSVVNSWIRYDWGSAKTMEYSAIAAHQLGSCGCTAKWQYSSDDFNWTDMSDPFTPTDDSPIVCLHPRQSARYARLLITNGASAPKIGVVHVGTILAMQRYIYGGHKPITMQRETELTAILSRTGVFLGQTFRKKGVKNGVKFDYLTAAWLRTNFDPFIKEARKFPFFFMWRPSTFPAELAYSWSTDDIQPSNMGKRDFMAVSWNMVGEGID